MDVEAVNATVVEMNPQQLVDKGRHIRRHVGRDTWQHASEVDAKSCSLADKLAKVEIFTLGEKLAEKMAYALVATLAS